MGCIAERFLRPTTFNEKFIVIPQRFFSITIFFVPWNFFRQKINKPFFIAKQVFQHPTKTFTSTPSPFSSGQLPHP
jgi:hypothetical protein